MKKMKEKICRHCGTKDTLRTNKNGVIYNCCIKCYTDIEIPEQIEKTNLAIEKKYGVKDLGELRHRRSIETPKKEKPKKEIVCRYCGSKDIVIKQTQNRIARYASCSKCWDLYQADKDKKRRQTNLERFGVEHPKDSKELQEKRDKTMLDRYGVLYAMQNPESLEKRNKVNIEKFGHISPMHNSQVKEKAKHTCLKNFGVEHPSKSKIIMKKAISTSRSRYWDKFLILLENKKISPNFSKEEYINSEGELSYHCNRCNKNFLTEGTEPQHIWCGCNQRRSNYEDQIIEWLTSNKITSIEPNKKFREQGKILFEIDIFLPEYKIGIDFHGLFWHSDKVVDWNYHQRKYKNAQEKGIQLIQIFEHEWLTKQNIVKSIILNKLGLNTKIYARKCMIQDIPNSLYKDFLEKNHLQGYIPASIKIGLFYNNDLVCVAAFGKARFGNKNSVEILRCAYKLNQLVIGGFARLLKHFENLYPSVTIMSFVDIRYFNGSGYIKSGFVEQSLTQPNYFYFKQGNTYKVYSRLSCQKHKLQYKLEKFDPLLSEYDNMINNGYLRIFDAGNMKFVKTFE